MSWASVISFASSDAIALIEQQRARSVHAAMVRETATDAAIDMEFAGCSEAKRAEIRAYRDRLFGSSQPVAKPELSCVTQRDLDSFNAAIDQLDHVRHKIRLVLARGNVRRRAKS